MSKLSVFLGSVFGRRPPVVVAPIILKPPTFADRIVRAMMARNYVLAVAPDTVNIVYVEGCNLDGTQNYNRPNAFDDARIVLVFENGVPVIKGVWDATTQTGKKYTLDPVPGARDKGAAIIELGQQRCWQVGKHRGYEALAQTGAVVVVARDLNKDFRRDNDRHTTGFYGINQHHGANAPQDDIGGHSAGCLVGRTVAGHKEFMKIVKTDPRYLADKKYVFRTTVMPFEWVK